MLPANYSLSIEQSINPQLKTWIHRGLQNYAEKAGVFDDVKPFSLVIKEGDKLVGALTRKTLFGSLHIGNMYVIEKNQRKGIGRSLVEKALELGKEWDCSFAVVETISFHALEFYQKLGFKIDFARKGYANNSMFYYLQKTL